jgi:hypothetical protein
MEMKAFNRRATTAFALAAAALAPLPAAATNIYDNISVSSGGLDRASVDGPLYDSFSTGSTAVDLTLVLANLSNNGVTESGGSFSVNLYADSSASPGVLLTTITTLPDSDLSTNIDSVGLFPASPIPLTADTRYWIGVVGAASSVAWSSASDSTGTGVTGEFWANNPPRESLVVTANSDAKPPYQMAVVVTTPSAPEPSTWAMLMLGFAGLAFVSYRFPPKRRAFPS